MKVGKSFLVIIITSLLLFIACTKASKENKTTKVADKQLRHVVLFKFKETASIDSIAMVEKAFAELPNKIKEIRDFEWGINNSPEGVNKGFTHSFLVTFHSEEDRAIYLPHPDHMAFVAILEPILDDVLVLDYWTEE